MKWIVTFVLGFVCVACCEQEALARGGRWSRGGGHSTVASSSSSSGLTVSIDPQAQQIAQARANAMAQYRIQSGHNIPNAPSWQSAPGARGEGVGYGGGSHQSTPTCIVGSVVIADAAAYNGGWYRVRIFR